MSTAFNIGEPTILLPCPHEGCDRPPVGPYYSAQEARFALAEHDRWRHQNFQLAAGVD
jgi:hypothetical protein